MPNGWRTINSLVHKKNRLHGRRGKGMAESFSRQKSRHAPQKEGGLKILCDLPPVWPRLVRPTNLMSRMDGKKTHTHTHTLHFFSFSFFHLTYSRWTSSLPSCLWSQRIFPSLPGSRLTIFLSRCKFSTLTTRQLMVEFYLLTFPRFPLRKKEYKSYFGKNRTHDFRTSRCMCSLPTRPLGRRTVLYYTLLLNY